MADFAKLDYNSTGTPNHIKDILTHGKILMAPGRGALWVSVVSDELQLYSDDGLTTIGYTPTSITIPQQFTFEATLRPDELPPDLNSLTKSLMFIAVFDQQDNAGGILLSKQGIAVVSTFGNTVMPIGGSQGLFEEGSTPYVLRLVVDGVQNLMNIYVTKESDLATYGHILKYTTVAPASPDSALDQLRIEVIGPAERPVKIRFRSLRLHDGMLVPNKRPVAHSGLDQTAAVDNIVQLDGSASYDPEGTAVTHKWFLTGTPKPSAYKITGTGATVGATNMIQAVVGGPWSEASAPGLQPGDLLVWGNIQGEVAKTGGAGGEGDWELDPTTKKYKRASTFDTNRLYITKPILSGTVSTWFVYHQDLCFTGTAIPTTPGTGAFAKDYDHDGAISLLEQNDYPWSVTACPFLQPGDKVVIKETLYTVATTDWTLNVATGWYERDTAFDGSKLKLVETTLPEQAGLKWEIYHLAHSFADRAKPKATWVPDKSGLYTFELVVNDGELDSLPAESLVNVSDHKVPLGFVPDVSFLWKYLPDFWNLVPDRDIIETFWGGMAQGITALMMTAWQMDYGKSLRDIPRLFQRRWVQYEHDYEEPFEYHKKQVFRIRRGPITGTADLATSAALDGKTLIVSWDGWKPKTVTFASDSLASPDVTGAEVVSQINAQLGVDKMATQIASLTPVLPAYYLQLTYNGLLEVDKDGTANALLGLSAAADSQNEVRGTGAPTSNAKVFDSSVTTDDMSSAETNDILYFNDAGHRVKRAINANSVELLDAASGSSGAWVLASTVEAYSSDFSEELVMPGDIAYFNVTHKASGKTVDVQCKVYGAVKKSLGFDPAPLYWMTSGRFDQYSIWLKKIRRCRKIPVNKWVRKIPRLQETILDPTTVRRMYDDYDIVVAGDDRAIQFTKDLFTIDSPPPEQHWAEVTYLDNSPMIEANFGDAVGLRADYFEEQTTDADYLSAVQGMWYAFFHGPTLFNLKLGVQILLGLPFTEVKGTIFDINLTFRADKARILIRDADDDAVFRSYLIPRTPVWESYGESPLAINPTTGVEFDVGDAVAAFQPLSKGVELVDYIKDPDWWWGFASQGGFQEIQKFFRFLVRADVDVHPVANLVFADSFLDEIRPGYTLQKLVALKRIKPSEIDVGDALTFAGTLFLFDDPACEIAGSYRWDDTDESGNWNHQWDPVMGSVDITGGVVLNGLTLDMVVGTVSGTVTFSGASALPVDQIADQINLQFSAEIASWYVHGDGKTYLTIQSDKGVTVEISGTANSALGFRTAVPAQSAKSMHVWDRRSTKCPKTYLEAYMKAPMPQTPPPPYLPNPTPPPASFSPSAPSPHPYGPATGTYFIPWDWIWAWDGGGGEDPLPLKGPSPHDNGLKVNHGAGPVFGDYPGTIQWDGYGAEWDDTPGSEDVTYGAYPSGDYERTKVLDKP